MSRKSKNAVLRRKRREFALSKIVGINKNNFIEYEPFDFPVNINPGKLDTIYIKCSTYINSILNSIKKYNWIKHIYIINNDRKERISDLISLFIPSQIKRITLFSLYVHISYVPFFKSFTNKDSVNFTVRLSGPHVKYVKSIWNLETPFLVYNDNNECDCIDFGCKFYNYKNRIDECDECIGKFKKLKLIDSNMDLLY